MKRNVLLIDGEADNFAPLFAAGLGSAGVRLHVLSTDPSALVRFSRFCAKFHRRAAEGDVLRVIRETVTKHGIHVIMACSDAGIRMLAQHRAALEGMARVAGTASVEQLDMVCDKGAFAEFLGTTTLPHPQSYVVRGGQWIESALPPFPVLLKPAVGDGGSGIRRVENLADFKRVTQEPAFAERSWVVQAYIPGQDVDVSILCRDGEILAHTIQTPFVSGSTSFAPTQSIRFVHDQGALEIARKLAEALHWTGLAHIDMRRDERNGRISIIELNARYWATAYGSLRAGVNFSELAFMDAMGEAIATPAYLDGPYVRLDLARKMRWQDIRFRDTQVVRYLKDPGPWLIKKLHSCRFRFLPFLQVVPLLLHHRVRRGC